MLASCRKAYEAAASDLDFVRLDKAAFEACRADSIDYAVMEKTDRASVVPLSAGWSDIGSFSALQEALGADASGNVTRGDVVHENSVDCLLYSTDRRVAAVGLEGHIVIETKDAVMVAPKGRAQDVKLLVERMKKAGRPEPGLHREVFRPWGSYDSVDAGPRFQVKRLTVKPGAKLSLQKHAHRAEHWVVVKGTARITRDHEVFDLKENESTYIPIGGIHRLANPGTELLEVVEVQTAHVRCQLRCGSAARVVTRSSCPFPAWIVATVNSSVRRSPEPRASGAGSVPGSTTMALLRLLSL
jgi:mannose-1-phosphate guanylyltransferase/mannose-6-phosphate isomerase